MVHSFVFGITLFSFASTLTNAECPDVMPVQLDLKELDGIWYITASAADLEIEGDCAMIEFKHSTENTTDIAVSWVTNKTMQYYNGTGKLSYSVTGNGTDGGDALEASYADRKTESFYFLAVNYEHYALVLLCSNTTNSNNDTDNNYEILKLNRRPHLKALDSAKIEEALTMYSMENTQFQVFNNTEECCKTSAAVPVKPASLLMSSAMAATIFRRLY